MKILRILFNQSTININTLIKDANKVATASTSKLVKSKAVKQNKASFFELIRKNKLASFLIILASSNLVYLFIPVHKTRPEILARNRLEKRE
jgi:hypothetical protein